MADLHTPPRPAERTLPPLVIVTQAIGDHRGPPGRITPDTQVIHSLDGAGPIAMKVVQTRHSLCVGALQALTYWPRYKREIERCLVQYGEKSAEEAAALVEERIRPPSGDGDCRQRTSRSVRIGAILIVVSLVLVG